MQPENKTAFEEMMETLSPAVRFVDVTPEPPCAECGMHTLTPTEYHPYAACVLFKSGMPADAVRATLAEIRAYGVKHA